MLKKNKPITFARPVSSMRLVLEAIENGHNSLLAIREQTNLNKGQVKSAVANLAYIGAICTRRRDEQGRAIYVLPGQIESVSDNLKGVNSIFLRRVVITTS